MTTDGPRDAQVRRGQSGVALFPLLISLFVFKMLRNHFEHYSGYSEEGIVDMLKGEALAT